MNGRSGPGGWALVALQLALLGALGIEVTRGMRSRGRPGWADLPGVGSALLGGGVSALGSRALGRRLRAHPAPSEDAVLRTDGAYAVVRHPIYLGLLLLAAGAAMIARTGRAAAALAALAALLHGKAGLEERLLTERFPEYPAYAARVPRLIPRPARGR